MNPVQALLTLTPLAVEVAMTFLVACLACFSIGAIFGFILLTLVTANGRDDEPAWEDGDEPK